MVGFGAVIVDDGLKFICLVGKSAYDDLDPGKAAAKNVGYGEIGISYLKQRSE